MNKLEWINDKNGGIRLPEPEPGRNVFSSIFWQGFEDSDKIGQWYMDPMSPLGTFLFSTFLLTNAIMVWWLIAWFIVRWFF